MLQRAAVVGREFSLGAVAALAEGDVAHSLLALSRAGFVHPAAATDPGDDGYTFHHVLLRDAAYAQPDQGRPRRPARARGRMARPRRPPATTRLVGHHLEQARAVAASSAKTPMSSPRPQANASAKRACALAEKRHASATGAARRAVALLPPGGGVPSSSGSWRSHCGCRGTCGSRLRCGAAEGEAAKPALGTTPGAGRRRAPACRC